MNRIHKEIIKLLCAFNENRQIDHCMLNPEELKKLYEEAEAHKLTALIYTAMGKDYTNKMESELYNKWKYSGINTVIIQTQNIKHIQKVLTKIQKSGVKVIGLKGLVLRNFYNNPLLRTMCDIDILIDSEDLNKVRLILNDIGYEEYESLCKHHIKFIHSRFLPIEVHWTILKDSFLNEDHLQKAEVWDEAVEVSIGDFTFLSLGWTDLAVYLLIHMASHIQSCGFGLRQLYDFYIFIEEKNTSIDWQDVAKQLQSYNLGIFAAYIFQCCNILFKLTIPIEIEKLSISDNYIAEKVLEEILTSGVFGDKNNKIMLSNILSNKVSQKYGSKKVTFLKVVRVILPTKSKLEEKYSYIKKNKLLIPLAYLHYIYVSFNKYGFKAKDFFCFFINGTSKVKKKKRLLKELEL